MRWAHDGNKGVEDGDGAWYYRTDAAATLGAGSVLSVWVWVAPETFGRLNLGFGATDTGADSFVISPATNQLMFQNNEGFFFSDANTQAFTFKGGSWYLATLTVGPSIVGRLYDSDGTTLLASLTASGLTRGATGGVAIRGVGAVSYDTIAVSAAVAAPAPEPASWAMMIAGFALGGAALRHRRCGMLKPV